MGEEEERMEVVVVRANQKPRFPGAGLRNFDGQLSWPNRSTIEGRAIEQSRQPNPSVDEVLSTETTPRSGMQTFL